ncbi:hypothetical protein D1BOALGB6SA_1906 [Olavius sp. associated proteobacterium Delta 1]|nr:hypothetical protein D1BOALGB6SA_1906 [Olavius sp. associated proteobacterium Delta 1]
MNREWTEPGLSPKTWLENQRPDDIILCKCEMVPKSAVQTIVNNSAIQKESVLFTISAPAAGSAKAPAREPIAACA